MAVDTYFSFSFAGVQNNFHQKEKGWFPRHCAVEANSHYSPKKDI